MNVMNKIKKLRNMQIQEEYVRMSGPERRFIMEDLPKEYTEERQMMPDGRVNLRGDRLRE